MLGSIVLALEPISCPIGVSLISKRSSRVRRKSPSVNTPTSLPTLSITVVMPMPLSLISNNASASLTFSVTRGISSPDFMMSCTLSRSCLPKVPPGCEKAKSSAVKPRASSKAMASASPITSAVVVLDVGARSRGQASISTPVLRWTSEDCPSADCALPVILTRGMPSLLR